MTSSSRARMRRSRASQIVSICGVATVLLFAPVDLAAQNAPTCGWSEPGSPAVPSTLSRLRTRTAEVPEWLPAAEELLLRWYRECDGTAARSAARNLQSVQEASRSSDPLLLAWLGVALARGPEVQIEHAEGLFLRSAYRTSNAERTAARLLAQVTERTGWPEVAQELAALGFATRKNETLRLASEAIAKAADEHVDAALWSALAEVELVRGERAGAERAAKKAAESGAPRAFRVAGILEMAQGSASAKAGAEQYLQGLSHAAADDDVAAFYDDIRLLLGEDELQEWRALAGSRADWIRRKWDWRAMMAGTSPAERLSEHFRRLEVAVTRYQQLSFRGAPPLSGIRTFEPAAWHQPLDDRGLVYLRHGEPAAELRTRPPDRIQRTMAALAGEPVNRIAWIYHGAEGNRVVEFDRGLDRSVYFLAEPYPICGRANVTGLGVGASRAYPPPGDLRDWAASLAPYAPSLADYYMACWQLAIGNGTGAEPVIFLAERKIAHRNAAAVLGSESARPPFTRPFEAAANLYAFRADTLAEVVAYLSVSAGAARDANPAGAGAMELEVLFSVGDPVSEQVTRLDTTLVFTPAAPLPPNATIHFVLPLRTPSTDRARVTLTVTNHAAPAAGQVMSTTRSVSAFAGGLSISDLVIAEPRTGVLSRGTHRLAPAPGHAIAGGTQFRLYYELYGARAGDPLSVSITMLPASEESLLAQLRSLVSQRRGLSVSFEEQASPEADGTLRVERDFSAELRPGAYSLLVTVRNHRTQESATAETSLHVVDRE